MTFYKRDGDTLLDAPNFVIGQGFELRAETHAENTYPVDGWYWFGSLDEAMIGLPKDTSPNAVTMRQARLALLSVGLLSAVDAAIASIPGAQGDAARIEWQFASVLDRSNPLLIRLIATLGLTDAQVTSLFNVAVAL